MGWKTIHMSMSVRGFLGQSPDEHRKAMNYITRDDGSKFESVHALRDAFFDKLAAGFEVIPMGDCDDFDPKTGCRGHAQAAADSSGPQEGGERD